MKRSNPKLITVLLCTAVILCISPPQLSAQNTAGPSSAASFSSLSRSGSSTSWTNTGNASSSDNIYADIPTNGISANGAYTDYFFASDFGFSIPTDATIDGILVEIERTDVNNAKDDAVNIVKGGSVGSEDKSLTPAWSAEAVISYGDATDLWSETWTASDINSSNFGVAFSVRKQGGGANPEPQIDHIQITISFSGGTLPVELLHFSAQAKQDAVALSWQTASEVNNDFFSIERSANGIDWQPIHFEKGAGNSNQIIDYLWMDHFPLNGLSYYQLIQTDYDGSFSYADVQTVFLSGEMLQPFAAYPNPTDDQLIITHPDDYRGKLEILSIDGKSMMHSVPLFSGSGTSKLDLSSLPPGPYLLTSPNESIVVYKR